MANTFFDHPILNSPCEHASCYRQLDQGPPTQQITEKRRLAEYAIPLLKPKRSKGQAEQASLSSDTSRPFDNYKFGYIAAKVINHLGNGMMRVFKCG